MLNLRQPISHRAEELLDQGQRNFGEQGMRRRALPATEVAEETKYGSPVGAGEESANANDELSSTYSVSKADEDSSAATSVAGAHGQIDSPTRKSERLKKRTWNRRARDIIDEDIDRIGK